MMCRNASTETFRCERAERRIDIYFASTPRSNRRRTSRHHVGGTSNVAHAATIAATSGGSRLAVQRSLASLNLWRAREDSNFQPSDP